MLKIVHQNCCGIDVHKKFVVATIANTSKQNVTTYQTRKFATYKANLLELRDWLLKNECTEICMESTGKYWIPIFNVLEDSCRITLANPKFVRAIPGKKTDTKDSIWLSDLHKHGLVPGSFIPPALIRQLRDLCRYRNKLINFRTSEKNRFQNSLTVSNIVLSNVVSDIFGKSAQRIIQKLLNDQDEPFDVEPLLHGSMKHKTPDIKKAIDGKIPQQQIIKMKTSLEHLNNINQLIDRLELEIYKLSLPFERQINLLISMPAIETFSAIQIISEIGTDMTQFNSDKHLCSWAGLTPQNNESAGKKKSVRISRAGVYIKPLLVQCANAAIKKKDNNPFKAHYLNVKRRRGHKKAIIAVARKMLAYIYHMILNDEAYDPKKHEKLECNAPTNSQPKPLELNQAIELLLQNGYTVSLDT